MTRPKICFLFTRPEPHRIPLLNLIAQQCEADFEILYCTKSTYQEHTFGEAQQHAMPHQYLSGVEWLTDLKNQSTTLWNTVVFKELVRMKPDLLLLAGYSNPTMILALSYAWIFGVRYGILNESHLLKKRAKWKLFLKKLILPTVFKNAFVTFSTGTKAKEYLEQYGAKKERIFIFPNTCDVDFFSKESGRYKGIREKIKWELKLKDRALVLIYVGRLVTCKGIETLLLAVREWKQQNVNVQLLIVGDGPLRQELEKSAQEKKLCEEVIFTGFVANLELPKYYSMADIFVFPSLEETWGVAVVEAMACGLPAILSDQVGAGYDLLREEKNGAQFKSGNVESLLKTVQKFYLNQTLLSQASVVSEQMVRQYTYLLGVESFREVVNLCIDGK